MDITIRYTPLPERRQTEYLAFLAASGLRDEEDADLIAWMTDEEDRLVACGALAGYTIKQLAVAPALEGQGAMASVLSALYAEATRRGISRLFLCTKPTNRRMFSSLGFFPVIETGDAVLMENSRNGVRNFLASLPRREGVKGAVVCNCDPFTLGHRHLLRHAAEHCDALYVFVVSDSGSMFTPEERYEMVCRGTADLPNCTVHRSDLYLVSRATFPAYFIRDRVRADQVRADLDIAFFSEKLAPALDLSVRFVGEEPFSPVTQAYNERMKELLPQRGIRLEEIPRFKGISASRVRELIRAGEYEKTRDLVPDTTYETILRYAARNA
ncbi:MAG: [Mogibacterium sp.]|nr:[citrate (pro-3S)-lyase] ligase [Mogibacterium sp.]